MIGAVVRRVVRFLDWRASAVDEWEHRRGAEEMLSRHGSPSPLRHRDPRVPPCAGVGDDLEAEGAWPAAAADFYERASRWDGEGL